VILSQWEPNVTGIIINPGDVTSKVYVKETNYRRINMDIEKVLELHQKWTNNEIDGVCANLSGQTWTRQTWVGRIVRFKF
jgi:hypothetical protein